MTSMVVLNSVEGAEIIRRPYGLMRLLAAKSSKKATTTNVDFLLMEIEPGNETSKHYHLKSEEVFFILKGRATLISKTTSFELKEKEVAIVAPGEIHCIRNNGKDRLIILLVQSPPYDESDKYVIEGQK